METHLLIMGIVLVGAEVLIPGFGIFGFAGILALLASLFFFLGGGVEAGLAVFVITLLGALALWYTLKYYPNSGLAKHLTLDLRFTTNKGYVSADTKPNLLGEEGVAHSVLRPAGIGKFGTKYIDVVSEDVFIEKGTPIRVVATSGSRVVVRSIESLKRETV